MTIRVDVRGELIRWARERARSDVDELSKRFPKIHEWETGEESPTLRQLEKFARATHTPVGFLFLSEPPEEAIPLPDFRTIGAAEMRRASPDLLDTIYICEQRQEWYRDYRRTNREDPLDFVGSMVAETGVAEAGASIRAMLEFQVDKRGPRWADAFRILTSKAEEMGVLVMVSGVVGNNTHRKLNPEEFRGFAIVDAMAPLVFVNGADTKAAQIFTLAHELAHVWLGQSALSDVEVGLRSSNQTERWCNQVAAELLVPLDEIREEFSPDRPLVEELDRLARVFKVSTLVVLGRAHDAEYLSRQEFAAAYRTELDRILGLMDARAPGGGGDFYNTQPVRVSRRFARAVASSALEGQTLFRDAFQLLGIRKLSTFHELCHRLGIE